MPNIKSAKKRCKVTSAKTLQNKIQKSEFKTEIKKVSAKIAETKDQEALNAAYKAIDQAAAKGIIHKNAAANKKSQLANAIK